MKHRRSRPAAGMTLIEVVLSMAILAVGIAGLLLLVSMTSQQSQQARELQLAQLGAARAREAVRTVRFRRLNATETSQSLFVGGYELARNAPTALNPQGTTFQMPSSTSTTLAAHEGIGGCLVVQFPIPPLAPIPGQTHPGRIVFFCQESGQDDQGTIPNRRFPFPPTPGLTGLDCDANGAIDTTDLRTRHLQAGTPAGANALRLMPVKVVVEWLTRGRQRSRYEESFLLSYQGYE
jgi:prepilin-type N-terminal cleavage/methylation domain-containing protein